jgi:hypothetical protein
MTDQIEVIAGQIWKLKEPEWAITYGQGEPPTAMKLQYGERKIELNFGEEFKASYSCDSNNEPPVLSTSSSPKLLRVEFIEENIDQFELVEDVEPDDE